jgi:hypothetical protein
MDLMTGVVVAFLAAFVIVGVYVTVKSEQFKKEEMKKNEK